MKATAAKKAVADLGNVLGASGLCPAYVEQCLTADTNLVSAVFSGAWVAGGLEERREGAPGHRCSRHGRARHQFGGCGVSACFLGLGCLLADPTPKATPYWRKLGFTRGKFWAKHFARCAVSGKYILNIIYRATKQLFHRWLLRCMCVRGAKRYKAD